MTVTKFVFFAVLIALASADPGSFTVGTCTSATFDCPAEKSIKLVNGLACATEAECQTKCCRAEGEITCGDYKELTDVAGSCDDLVHTQMVPDLITKCPAGVETCSKTCCLEKTACHDDAAQTASVDVLECKHCKCGKGKPDGKTEIVTLKSVFDKNLKNEITKRSDCSEAAAKAGAKYYNWYESRMVDEDRCLFGKDSKGVDISSEEHCGKQGRTEGTRRPWQIWSIRPKCVHNCAGKVQTTKVADKHKCDGLDRLIKWEQQHQRTAVSLEACAEEAYAAGAKYFSYNDVATETEKVKKWCYHSHKWSSEEACVHSKVPATGENTNWAIYHPYCQK